MADYNAIRSQATTKAAEIDVGLRAHMNKVYSTMSVGMLITALAAWAIAGLATTTDPSLAVGTMRNGTMLTGLGAAIYTSAFKWVVMFAPLAMIFGLELLCSVLQQMQRSYFSFYLRRLSVFHLALYSYSTPLTR